MMISAGTGIDNMKDIIFKIIKYLRWKTGSLVNRPGGGATLAVPGAFRPIYHSREMIRSKQEMLKKLRDEYFTMEGVCGNIIRMLEERGSKADPCV